MVTNPVDHAGIFKSAVYLNITRSGWEYNDLKTHPTHVNDAQESRSQFLA